MRTCFLALAPLLLLTLPRALAAGGAGDVGEPPFRVLDLDRGEAQEVQFADGKRVRVKLLEVREQRDSLRSAIREASVRVEVGGVEATVPSGNYNLPVTVGDV